MDMRRFTVVDTDIDFMRWEIFIWDGKGFKGRVTICKHASDRFATTFSQGKSPAYGDLAQGLPPVYLPYALECKYPTAVKD